MRLAYFGSDDFGLPALETLAASARHTLVGVVSQPDRPAGRGRHLTPTPVSQWARTRNGLPLLCPERVNRPEVIEAIRAWGADVGVVIAFGQKISNAILDLFAHGCVNLHSSLLPRFRGAAPVNWSIVSGDRESGLTVFRLVEKMDAGPVVYQTVTPIGEIETAGELRARLAKMGPRAVLDTLDAIEDGRAEFRMQDESFVTLAPKLHRPDGIIDWAQPAGTIAARIRGLYPWPGVHSRFVGQAGRTEDLVLARAVAVSVADDGTPPGVVRTDLSVAAGQGAVRLLDVKPASSRLMSFSDFVNGRKVRAGDRFIEVPLTGSASNH